MADEDPVQFIEVSCDRLFVMHITHAGVQSFGWSGGVLLGMRSGDNLREL